MAYQTFDRILETTTTTGTGPVTLAGAVTGFRTFASKLAVADTCHYHIEAVDGAGNPTGDWETGLGTYSAASTLTRTTVLDSSTGSAVSLAAGTKRVGISWLALDAKPPVMSAVLTTASTAITSGTPAVILYDTKDYDTDSYYTPSTGKFQPTKPGYYQISAAALIQVTSLANALVSIWKNGTEYIRGGQIAAGGLSGAGVFGGSASALIAFNGSTDYIDIRGTATGTSPVYLGGLGQRFTAEFVRGL